MTLEFWDIADKIGIILTIIGVPSIFILYFNIWKNLKEVLRLDKSKYISKRMTGKISFDYSNNDGKFEIGKDAQLFELKFSKGSDTSIHMYNDPACIEGLGIATNKNNIKDITDASIYDITSRVRSPQKGEIVILKNRNGNYCALKIIDIKDRTRHDKLDKVIFEYTINDEGYKNFSN